MPRFIAAHTVPWTEEQLNEIGENMIPKLPPGILFKLTYCDFDDGKFFCEWEAPSKEAIEQIFRDLEIPYDGIYEVKVFDVATATLEEQKLRLEKDTQGI